MDNEKFEKIGSANDNWVQMAKEVDAERSLKLGQEALRSKMQDKNLETREIAKDNEADLRVWQNMPIGFRGTTEAKWRENATISELEERKEFDWQIDEIMDIYVSDEYRNKGREGVVELARQLLGNQTYNKYAVAAAMGPSIIMDIIEEDPSAVGNFNMGAFVSKLSDPTLDKNTAWELNCRMLIATQLERYAAPNLGVDIEKFISSESVQTKLFTLDHITNVVPDFNIEEFLARACEDEPRTVCSNAADFLKQGVNFPITEIERKLRAETKQKVKDESEDEWKRYYVNNFEEDISRLMKNYSQYGQLSDDDSRKINQELDRFHQDMLKEERNPQEEATLGDILQETIDSFNAKYQEYQEKYAGLDRQYYSGYDDVGDVTGEKLTVEEYISERKKLAKEVIKNLDGMELSYFRREFIRRSYLFEGDESFDDGEVIENGYSKEYNLIHELYKADEKLFESNEYRAYKKRALEKEKKDCMAKLEAMSEEELQILRRQRLEYELNDIEPISYEDENGDCDWGKYHQNDKIKTLWKYDEGWDDSEEGKEVNLKKRERWSDKAAQEWAELLVKYPDIFKNPDLDEIDHLVERMISKIPRDKVYEIGKLKESGKYRQADQAEIDLFVSIFGLEYRPNVEYSDKDTDCQGSYAHRLKRVEVRRKFGGRDDEDGIVNTIAHEMWHAHQHDEADHDTERGKKYKVNNEHYQNGQPGWDLIGNDIFTKWSEAYNRYRNQLLEVEAFTFGQAFADYYKDVMENGVDAHRDTSAELDDIIKEKQKVEKIKRMSPSEIINSLSELKEGGFSNREITDYLAHCYVFYTDDGAVIVNTMIDNKVDLPSDDQNSELYGHDLMIEHIDKLLEAEISEIDIIDSLYHDDVNLDWIEFNDGSSVGYRSFFNSNSTTRMGEDVVYRSSGVQDLLLAVYRDEARRTNITRARNRIEKAIEHFQNLRGIESEEEREKEKMEYLFEMLERIAGA